MNGDERARGPADYFCSDIHLRFDQPERGERFARFVDGLGGRDSLTIAGDLCDFWLSSRQCDRDPNECAGLSALRRFRDRGRALTILLGNHDLWMGPRYERWLGATVVPEPLVMESHGLRLHAVHGHLLGARKPWKALMEGRAFLGCFRALPERAARLLEDRLKSTNDLNLARTHARHLSVYREYASRLQDDADLILFGHVHEMFDEPAGRARLIVLGDWFAGRSYLRIDDEGARMVSEREASTSFTPAGRPA